MLKKYTHRIKGRDTDQPDQWIIGHTHICYIWWKLSNKIMNPQDYLPHSLTFFLNKNYFE